VTITERGLRSRAPRAQTCAARAVLTGLVERPLPTGGSINGAGCLTLLPYQSQEISGSTASGPQQAMGSAWVGIASAPGSAFTVYEWE
jgi:hypothetical protein